MPELLIDKPVQPTTGLTDKPKNQAISRDDRIQAILRSDIRGGQAPERIDLDLPKYQPYLGHVNISADINEARAQSQSIGQELAFGAGRLVGTTATKLFQGLGYAAASVPAVLGWDADIMLDNGFSAMFEQAEEYMKDEMMPIYHTNKYKQGNVLQQMSTLSFWMDDVVDGAAFMISNLIGAKGVGMLGEAAGGYGKLAKTFSSMSKAAKTGKAIKGASNLKKWTNTMDLATMSLYNSVTEAAFEAKDLKNSLMSQGLSNTQASEAAMNAFWSNVTILMGPNMLTNSMVFKKFKPTKGSASSLFKDGKIVKENLKSLGNADMAGAFAKNAAISMGSEGLWEENIQLAIQNYETGRALGTDDRGRLQGLMEEWATNFTTDEGQKAMVLGALIGLIPGGVGGAKQARAERENLIQVQQMMGLTLDAYQGKLDQLLIQKEEGDDTKGYKLDPKTGKPMLNIPMMQEMWEAHVESMRNTGHTALALDANNETYYNFLMEQRLASLATRYIEHPDGKELYKLQLDALAEQELELIEKTGNTELEDGVRELKTKYEQKADYYQDVYNAINNNYTAFIDYGDSQEATDFKNTIGNKIFMEAVNQSYWQDAKTKAEGEISKIQSSNMSGTELGNTEVARYEKQITGINQILQKSERTFRTLTSKKAQDEAWKARNPVEKAKEIEDVEVSVQDNEGNNLLYLGKEGKEHTIQIDEEGNLAKLTDEEVKSRGLKDANGNFIIEPDKVKDEEGNEYILEGKEGDQYRIRDAVTGEIGLATAAELKTLKFVDEELGSVEEKVIQRDKNLVAAIARKYDAIKNKLSREGKADKLQLDKELVDQLGTHRYDNYTFDQVFDKAGITGDIPVIHRGIMGDLSRSESGAKVVFTPYSGGQSIKFLTKSKKTLAENSIFVYSSYTFDMLLHPDGRTIIVNGVALSNYHKNPLNAIVKDKQGNPVGIRLWKGTGFVYIRNAAIVADLAVAIPMLEEARARALDYMKEANESFVMVADPKAIFGKEYQVFKKNGEYVVAHPKTGKRYNDTLTARILDTFFESLDARIKHYNEFLIKNNTENIETTKEDIRNELREFDNIIRQATPEEINASKSAAEVQGVDPETKAAERLPNEPEGQLSKYEIDAITWINTLTPQQHRDPEIEEDSRYATVDGLIEDKLVIEKDGVYTIVGKVTEVEDGKKVEEEIIDNKAQEAAEEEAKAEMAQEESKAQEDPLEAHIETETINDDEIPLREKTALEEGEIEGVNPANTIAYNYEHMPVFTEWASNKENRLSNYDAHFFIDYTSDHIVKGFWLDNADVQAKISMGKLTEQEIDALLEMPNNAKFDNLVDTIPIKVVLIDKDGNKAPGETLHLHETTFKTRDARMRTPQEVDNVRIMRRKVLERILEGNSPVITALKKTKGQYNNRVVKEGENRNDLIANVFTKTDIGDIRLGVAKGTVGRIRRGDDESMPGKGNNGNVFMLTDETCNGEESIVKLNSSKITNEHALILFEAYKQAYLGGETRGFSAMHEGPHVQGLTNSEVINMLVLEGKKYTSQKRRNEPKAYLESKQLWVEDKIIYYGEQGLGVNPDTGNEYGQIHLNDKKHTAAEANLFIAWLKGNKNYAINRARLNTNFKKDFKLGRLQGIKGESYETFVIKNGFVKTDLVHRQPFIAPVIIFDNATLIGEQEVKAPSAATTPEKTVGEQEVRPISFVNAADFANIPIGTNLFSEVEEEIDDDQVKIVRYEWFEVVTDAKGNKVLKVIMDPAVSKFKFKKAIQFEGANLNNVEEMEKLLKEFPWHSALAGKVLTNSTPAPTTTVTDPVTKKKKKKINPLDFLRMKTTTSNTYQRIDVQKATKWLRKKLPAGEVKWLDDLIKVGDIVAYGQFSRDVITLSKEAEAGTEYHEAYHRISLGFLTDAHRKSLYAEARTKYNLQDKTDKVVEEFLAEKFRQYTIVKNKQSFLKGIGNKIAAWFRQLTDFFRITEKQSPKDIESVFEAITEGYYRKSELIADNEYVVGSRTWLQNKRGLSSENISTIVKGLVFLTLDVNKIESLEDVKKLTFGTVQTKLKQIQEAMIANDEINEADNYEMVLEDFEYWTDLVESYLRSFKIIKKTVKTVAGENVEEDGTELDVDTETAANDFARHDQASYESNFKDNVLSSIKFLIMKLSDGTETDEFLGLPKYVDFNSTWNSLMTDLHNADNITEMLDILVARSEGDTAYAQLHATLKAGNEMLRTQFEISIKRTKHNFIDLIFEIKKGKPEFQFQNTDTQRASRRFVKQWSDLFYASPFFQKEKFMSGNVNNVIKQYEKLEEDVVSYYDKHGKIKDLDMSMNDTIKLLNNLSIPVDVKVLKYILATKNTDNLHEALKLFVMNDIEHLFGENGILKRRVKGIVKNERGFTIKDNELFTDERVIDKIAEAYVHSKPEELSVTVLGPASNPYFVYAANNYVTDTIRDFKKDPNNIKDLLNTVNSKNSFILNQLLNNPKILSNFDVRTFSGFIQKNVGDVGRDYLGLNEAEDFLLKLSAIHKGFKYNKPTAGMLPMPTLADRKTYYLYDGMEILDYKMEIRDGVLAFPEQSDVVDIFVKYAEDERNRIKLVKEQIETALKTKNSSNLYEGLHYVIKTEEEAKHLLGKGAKFEIVDTDIIKVFVDSKGNYYGNGAKYQHFKAFENADAWKNPETTIKLGFKHITDSTIWYAAELGIITAKADINGRPAIQDNVLLDEKLIAKVATEEFNGNRQFAMKRILANYAVNTMMAAIETEKMLSGDVANYKGETSKQINEDKIKRLTVLTSTGDNLRIIFPADHELHGKNTYTVTTLNTSKLKSAYHEGLIDKHAEIYKKEAEKDNKPITDEKARKLAVVRLFKYGIVDQTDAQVYISPTMYRSLLMRLGEWSNEKQRAFDILQSDKEPSLEEEKMALNLLMPPLKFVHYGLYAKSGLAVPIFDKMSMAPLFKRFVKDTNLEELYNRMELQGKYSDTSKFKAIDMVKFDTAVKVGNTERVNYYKDKNPTTVRDMYADMLPTQTQNFKYLRRQLLTDPHDVDKTLFGTQVKKLGMSNVVKTENYKVGDDTMSGEELTTEWTEMLKAFSEMGKTELLRKLGITRKNETDSYKISDPTKLMEMLRKDAISSGMPDNIVDALKVETDNELYMTIDALPERKWIYSRLISLVSKHTVDIELPGNAFIQMTNFGLDKMSDAEADAKRIEIDWLDNNGTKRTRPLKFYGLNEEGGVTPMECYVSINLFKRVIPNYENLTWAQKKAWVKEHPEIMGWRIPTQGLNSISHLKVVGLLPEQLGDTIVLPAEFTALTGSDFDIDKLFIARYNYDKDGKEIKYVKGKKNSKKAMENRLLDMYKAVITSPHHYTQVTTPLDASTALVKNIYKKVIELNGESTEITPSMWELSPRYQAEVKNKYTGGKGGIGPFALGNAHHPLGQIAGLALKEYIGVGNYTEIDGKKVTDLSKARDERGEYILDWMSALINAHVDVAKDPYILALNVNAKTYGVTNLLIRAGAGELTFWFMPQPILVDLAKEDATQKGKLRGKKGKPGAIIKARYTELYEKALRKEGKKFKESGYSKAQDVTIGEEAQVAISEPIWDQARLANDIDISTPRDSKFYLRQLQILAEYQNVINKEANNLNEVVMASQIDTKKYGSNLSEIVGFINRYNKIWEDDALHNTDKLFKDTFLDTLFNNSVQLSKDLFGQLTITGTRSFQDALTHILQVTGNGHTIDNKYINFVADELFSAISSQFFVDELGATTEKVKQLFYGPDGIVPRIARIKNGTLYPELKDNRLINLLKTEIDIDTNDPNKLTLHSTNIKEKWDRDELVRAWEDILYFKSEDIKKQEAIRSLGRHIIMYAFYSSGFNKTLTSFYSFIPNTWLKEAGYSDYMTRVLKEFKEGTDLSSLHQAMDELFINNSAKTKLNSRMPTKELVPTLALGASVNNIKPKGAEHTTIFKLKYDITSDNYMGTNLNNEPVYSPYVLDPSGHLYKYVGYDRITKDAVYRIIPNKKGYGDKGFVIKEYFLDGTVLPDNKTEISAKAMEDTEKILRGESIMPGIDHYRDIEIVSLHSIKLYKKGADALKTSASQAPTENSIVSEVQRNLIGGMLEDIDTSNMTNQEVADRLSKEDGIRISAAEVGIIRGIEDATPILEDTLNVSEEERALQEKYKQFVAESPFAAETSKADIPQNLISGKEAFGMKQIATNIVQGVLGDSPHSIDMIEKGLRTRTTRSASEMEKYNIKVGDTITHVGRSADGTIKRVKAYVTAIHLKGTPGYTESWEREGWTAEGVKSIERYKQGAAAIEFQKSTDTIFSTEPFEIFKILDKYGKTFYDLTSEAQDELRDKYKHCK